MVVRRAHIPAIGALAALAACGGLENPDLAVGVVSGRVANAAASGGYVYVLGAPDRQAGLASDGSYTVSRVPVGAQQLVLVSAAGGVTRAELVPVEVVPGMRTQAPDRDAAAMSPAGRLLAAALPFGGSRASKARFTVDGTIYQDVGAGAVVVGDLPAGTWTLTTRLPGFRAKKSTVLVPAGGDSSTEEHLDIDDEDEERGCLSATCSSDLQCYGADGECYACLGDPDCQSGETCDPGTRTCVASSGGGAYCDSASSASQCASGVMVPTSTGLGYCSLSCPGGQSDCPSGWGCQASADGPRCQVLDKCVDVRATFGSTCVNGDGCSENLFGGMCLKAEGADSGTCTAPCASDRSCTDAGLSGWTCLPRPGGTSLYCQPPSPP